TIRESPACGLAACRGEPRTPKRCFAVLRGFTVRFFVLGLLCLAAMIAYVQRAALSVPAKAIEHNFGLSATELGLVMTAWYAGYAVLQLPSGWLADRWGSRRALTLFAVGWS